MEATNNEHCTPHSDSTNPGSTNPTAPGFESLHDAPRTPQSNSLASFPAMSSHSLSPKPEEPAVMQCPSGTTTSSPNAQTRATHVVIDDDESSCDSEFPPPYPVHEEAPLAVTPTAEQRQTNVVKALQGKMADFISGSSPRHYRTIVRELSDRQIPLSLLSDASRAKGLAQMLEEDVCTLSELVILGQFAKAIDDSDTRAAEFLRDTAGYKPQTDVTVEHKTQGLASLTDAQLLTLLQALNPEQSDEVNDG